MLKIVFIRHEKTYGNTLKRYIGTTDEPLLDTSIDALAKKTYPKVAKVYCSPMQRTAQTARVIYQNIEPIFVEALKECDFGEFENKNYLELADSDSYSGWVASNGTLPFPQGEEIGGFKTRCVDAFTEILRQNVCADITIAVVAHGGTIMSIMEAMCDEKQDYYRWQTDNGGGYLVAVNGDNTLKIIEKF